MRGFGCRWRGRNRGEGHAVALGPHDCGPLHRWRVGSRLRVVEVGPADNRQAGLSAKKLASLGIVPGTTIVLVQKSPLPVIAIGNSEFAVDMGIAGRLVCALDDSDSDESSGARRGGPAGSR